VLTASDSDQAVQLFREKRDQIELILMDVVMPKLSGFEAYAQISELEADVPVIFTTGYSAETALLTTDRAKAAPLLQKPYAPRTLAQTVREALDHGR
jgi:CheY-like chemotaxis protein